MVSCFSCSSSLAFRFVLEIFLLFFLLCFVAHRDKADTIIDKLP